MADRSRLHIKHLDEFREFLRCRGYADVPLSRNVYEVLRMKKDKHTVVVYQKSDAKEHLSVMDKDAWLVSAFLFNLRSETKRENTEDIR